MAKVRGSLQCTGKPRQTVFVLRMEPLTYRAVYIQYPHYHSVAVQWNYNLRCRGSVTGDVARKSVDIRDIQYTVPCPRCAADAPPFCNADAGRLPLKGSQKKFLFVFSRTDKIETGPVNLLQCPVKERGCVRQNGKPVRWVQLKFLGIYK